MPNTLRIKHLTEASRVLETQITAAESKPDREKSATDLATLKSMWAQRALYSTELQRLNTAQKFAVEHNVKFGE